MGRKKKQMEALQRVLYGALLLQLMKAIQDREMRGVIVENLPECEEDIHGFKILLMSDDGGKDWVDSVISEALGAMGTAKSKGPLPSGLAVIESSASDAAEDDVIKKLWLDFAGDEAPAS